MHDPFTDDELAHIFRLDPETPDRLISREGQSLEFKVSFSFAGIPQYARTLAAYSNASGGYIVFGVANNPRRAVGLTNQRFTGELDPERLTRELNQCFAPEIHWDMHVHCLHGRTFGLVYAHESAGKPVICTADFDDVLKEGDIYYRYRGQTRRIRYPELRDIIEQRRQQEEQLWLETLRKIAKIGVGDAAILNLADGEVSGPGGTYVIDESLLDAVQFIREGHFDEVEGDPAIKVVGQATVVGAGVIQPTREVLKPTGIHTADIVDAFLAGADVSDPMTYFRAICHETCGSLPFYNLLAAAGVGRKEALTAAEAEPTTARGKRTLVERLQSDERLLPKMPSPNNAAGRRRLGVRAALLGREIKAGVAFDTMVDALHAIQSLGREEVQEDYLRGLLRIWFGEYYFAANGDVKYQFRNAIVYLDFVLNADAVKRIPDAEPDPEP